LKHSSSQKASLWQVVKSVAASAMGVQSDVNYKRDFEQSSFVQFLLVGIVFVIIFVVTLIAIVKFAVAA
jgi:hypothetical protein